MKGYRRAAKIAPGRLVSGRRRLWAWREKFFISVSSFIHGAHARSAHKTKYYQRVSSAAQASPTVTSYGRLVKRVRQTSIPNMDIPEDDHFILVSADFDHDLKLFVIVHYRPVGNFSSGWGKN